MKRNQQGMTFLSFVITLAVVGFFGFLIMRVFPVYSEYYSVVTAIKSVSEEAGADKATPEAIRNSIERHFEISYVENVNLEKDIKFIKNNEGRSLLLNYEVRRPLMYNLDFVAKFEKSFPLTQKQAVE
ncbi:MAG: DUF4845 domain-containing protein [Arenimonas sp.]|nr:DUF4845 domain-containing protein [Arenimonas sp.]